MVHADFSLFSVCTGNAKPTDVEFSSLGKALGLTDVGHVIPGASHHVYHGYG